jgi:hypothetical protein
VIRKAKALAEADAQHIPRADRHFAILCEMAEISEMLPTAIP